MNFVLYRFVAVHYGNVRSKPVKNVQHQDQLIFTVWHGMLKNTKKSVFDIKHE